MLSVTKFIILPNTVTKITTADVRKIIESNFCIQFLSNRRKNPPINPVIKENKITPIHLNDT